MASEAINHRLIILGSDSTGSTKSIYETNANLNPLFIWVGTDCMAVLNTKSYLDGLGR